MKFLFACIPPLLWLGIPAVASACFAVAAGDGLLSLLALFFGGAITTLVFAAYYWFFGARDVLWLNPNTTMTQGTLRTVIGVLAAVLIPLLIFGGVNELSMQLPTLFEKDLKGSTELKQGNKILWNKDPLSVEHPNVKHTISVWPRGEGIDDDYKDVTIYIKVLDPSKNQVLDAHSISKKAEIVKFEFVPEQAGDYLLLITAGTPDVPGLHVWITEPQKKNGRRNIN